MSRRSGIEAHPITRSVGSRPAAGYQTGIDFMCFTGCRATASDPAAARRLRPSPRSSSRCGSWICVGRRPSLAASSPPSHHPAASTSGQPKRHRRRREPPAPPLDSRVTTIPATPSSTGTRLTPPRRFCNNLEGARAHRFCFSSWQSRTRQARIRQTQADWGISDYVRGRFEMAAALA